MSTGMTKYISHKVVEAAKILDVISNIGTPTHTLKLEDGKFENVDDDWIERRLPEGGAQNGIGGMFIRYPDGYTSWSPAETFDEGYTILTDDPDDGLAEALSGLETVTWIVSQKVASSRNRSLVMTKIEEAEMWLKKCGNNPPPGLTGTGGLGSAHDPNEGQRTLP